LVLVVEEGSGSFSVHDRPGAAARLADSGLLNHARTSRDDATGPLRRPNVRAGRSHCSFCLEATAPLRMAALRIALSLIVDRGSRADRAVAST
jgi:hypothetical protein